jgi:hypothetical protein
VTEENYDLMNKIELLDKEFSDKETRAKEEVGWFNEVREMQIIFFITINPFNGLLFTSVLK